jgi:hypothetical protein
MRQRAIVLTTVKMWPGDVVGWGEAGATANLDSRCARWLVVSTVGAEESRRRGQTKERIFQKG